MFQILSLFDGIPLAREGCRGDSGTETGATLVQKQNLQSIVSIILAKSSVK